MQAFDAPVSIHVHSKRHRLTDADGLCAKWVIDAIVKAGILVNDSPAYVEAVTFSQEKISVSESETTTITIVEA